jgi:FdhE protein
MLGPAERQSDTSRFAQDLVKAMEKVPTCGSAVNQKTEPCTKELIEGLVSGKPIYVFNLQEPDKRAAQEVFERLLSCFNEHIRENAESLENLDTACQNGSLSAEQLLRITLDNCWSELRSISYKFSIDLDLLQLFTIYLARPFRQQMAEQLTAEVDLGLWQQGYCPVCGHSPVLGHLLGKEGRRWLWCCCCNTRWRFPRIQCPFCMNQSQAELGYLSLEGVCGYRIYVCDQCRRYLKEMVSDSDENAINIDYDREYITSASLDQAALTQGYISEPIWINRYDPPDDAGPEVCTKSKEI